MTAGGQGKLENHIAYFPSTEVCFTCYTTQYTAYTWAPAAGGGGGGGGALKVFEK